MQQFSSQLPSVRDSRGLALADVCHPSDELSQSAAASVVAWSRLGASLARVIGAALLALLTQSCSAVLGRSRARRRRRGCRSQAGAGGGIVLGPPGTGQLVGATEYGGPGDPSSGTVGASGANLLEHPDSYAELGGTTFQTATAMGGLPYMTPLRITWGERSAIAYKRDFGFGGGPIDGLPRVIDLWWEFAGRLGHPVRERAVVGPGADRAPARPPAPATCSARAPPARSPALTAPRPTQDPPVRAGERRAAYRSPRASAPGCSPTDSPPRPRGAPLAVKGIIAAGNQIVGKPYVYGGGHGLPLSEVAPAYDCSSSVEHLLYGARPAAASTTTRRRARSSRSGSPGPGRWVTIYASADHVFMYVAGLRWDTHNAAGPGDGSSRHRLAPAVRSAAGFVARHPVGL